MRNFKFVALALLALTLVTSAQVKTYVPDYFPSPMGAEWHYSLTTSMGTEMTLKTVVTERPDAAKTGYNVVQTTYTPQESKNYYLKKAGWVFLLKTEMPSSNYSLDLEEDKNDLMNPLKVGATWEYKGKGISKTGTQDWAQSWKVEGAEEITVPAGTYKAMKVSSTSNVAGNVTKYTFWYVDQVGLVRADTAVGSMTTKMVLTKVVFPKN